jgi:hypothetical protein
MGGGYRRPTTTSNDAYFSTINQPSHQTLDDSQHITTTFASSSKGRNNSKTGGT